MTTGVLIWLVLGAASAGLYFVIAAVVSVRGVGDLRNLLVRTVRPGKAPDTGPSESAS